MNNFLHVADWSPNFYLTFISAKKNTFEKVSNFGIIQMHIVAYTIRIMKIELKFGL